MSNFEDNIHLIEVHERYIIEHPGCSKKELDTVAELIAELKVAGDLHKMLCNGSLHVGGIENGQLWFAMTEEEKKRGLEIYGISPGEANPHLN